MVTINHYLGNFNISRTFKDVSNNLQNFPFMETMVFEIAGGGGGGGALVKGVGTKRFSKERVKVEMKRSFIPEFERAAKPGRSPFTVS